MGKVSCLTIMLIISVNAWADIYQWRNAQGYVTFGQQPPNATTATPVKVKTSVLEPTWVKDRVQRQVKLLHAFAEERQQAQAQAERKHQVQQQQLAYCHETQQRHTDYVQAHFLYENTADGSRIILSDDKRQQEQQALATYIADHCD